MLAVVRVTEECGESQHMVTTPSADCCTASSLDLETPSIVCGKVISELRRSVTILAVRPSQEKLLSSWLLLEFAIFSETYGVSAIMQL